MVTDIFFRSYNYESSDIFHTKDNINKPTIEYILYYHYKNVINFLNTSYFILVSIYYHPASYTMFIICMVFNFDFLHGEWG